MRRPMTRLAYWIGIRRWPSWMKTIAAITASARNGIITLKTWSGVRPPGLDAVRQAGDDRGEDHQRDAVADAALGDQLAHPHQQDAARGEADDDQEDVRRVEVRSMTAWPAPAPKRPEEEDVADRLGDGEADGEVARVLRDALLADLALLLSFSSEGTTTVSSCRMIEAVMYGMIPSAKSAIRDRPPPLNMLSRPRTPPPPNLLLDVLDASTLMPGHRDVRAEAVQRQHRRREEQLLADVRDA